MLYLSIILFSFITVELCQSCPILLEKQQTLEFLKLINTKDVYSVTSLENEINLLKIKCDEEETVPTDILDTLKCVDSSYRCNAKGYESGCPCWTYESREANGTTKYTFGTYHQTADSVSPVAIPEETVLKECDYVNPPFEANLLDTKTQSIWEGFNRNDLELNDFTHCVRGDKVECFCSSTRSKKLLSEEIIENFYCENGKFPSGSDCWDVEMISSEPTRKLFKSIRTVDKLRVKSDDELFLEQSCNHHIVFSQIYSLKRDDCELYFSHCVEKGQVMCYCNYKLECQVSHSGASSPECAADSDKFTGACVQLASEIN